MKVLYLGDNREGTTSLHRANAMRRLGHEVTHLDPSSVIPQNRYVTSFNVRTGYRLFANHVDSYLRRMIGNQIYDLAWIDCGAPIPPSFHEFLNRNKIRIINYNIDDPFGKRDHRKWDQYKMSVRYHDLTVVVREENIVEAKQHEAKNVLRVYRSYDPIAHAPFEMTSEDSDRFSSEVVFVGTWMPERGPFMIELLNRGVPLSIWGDNWQKDPNYHQIKTALRGKGVFGKDYIKAIMGAKIAIGLVSKENRDLHTTRSAEIPYIGKALFCAENTSEHRWMFKDGEDAILFESAKSCSEKIMHILNNTDEIKNYVSNAKNKIIRLGLSNDEIIKNIINYESK